MFKWSQSFHLTYENNKICWFLLNHNVNQCLSKLLMSYLRYLCLFAYSGVQHILCCVFALFLFVLCTLCCQFLWIVRFWLPLRLVYPMLPVSMDSPSLIATSVFPYVYLPKHITKPVRYVDILNNNYLKNIRHITISEEL